MIDKKLHNLKTKILRTENIDDAMREELVNDIFEIEKLVNYSNVIPNVIWESEQLKDFFNFLDNRDYLNCDPINVDEIIKDHIKSI